MTGKNMVRNEHVLSVATNPDGDIVHVHGDLEGLKLLHEMLGRMIVSLGSGRCDHDHLRSEEWAGAELSVSMLESEKSEGYRQVHHVKLFAWNDERRKKHGV